MKYFRFFLVTFVLSILLCSPIFAGETSTQFRDIYDLQNQGHYLLNKSDAIKEWVVYVEDTQDIYILFSNLGVCYYYMPFDVGAEEITFYDGFYYQINSGNKTISYNFSAAKTAPYDMYYHYEHLGNGADAVYYDSVYENIGDFIEDLKNYDSLKEYIERKKAEFNDNYLPMLHYSLEKNHVLGFPNLLKVKENFKWDYTEYDIYKNDPSKYTIEIVASTNLKDAETGIGKVFDAYTWAMNDTCKINISPDNLFVSNNSFSFMYDDVGKKVYDKLGESWDGSTCGYYLYIRTREFSGSKVSYWKVYKVCMGGYVQQMGIKIDESGNQSTLDDSDYDIENDTSNGDYSTDNSDDASSSPGSDLYDGTGSANASTVVAELRNIVSTLGQIPALLSMVCSWIPGNIITLISVGIGLIVVVGIVKWVL